MKRPQPDLNLNIVTTFIAKSGANRRFKRLWGTATVKGTEVLNSRRHYYTASTRPANYKDLFAFLGVTKDVDNFDGKGIKSAWFTLNKSKSNEDLSVPKTFIVDNLNKMWWDTANGIMPQNLTLTTSVVIGTRFDRTNGVDGIDWSLPKDQIATYIVANYDNLWKTHQITQEGIGVINKGTITDAVNNTQVPDNDDLTPDDPWLAILSRYALRTNGVPCTIKDVEVGLVKGEGKSLLNSAVVTIEIPYVAFTSLSNVVTRIYNDLSLSNFPKPVNNYAMNITYGDVNGIFYSNESLTQSLAKQVTYLETVADIDPYTITRSYGLWENSTLQVSVYNNLWIEDKGIWYLKADVIDNPHLYSLTHQKLNSYLFGLLDTGYKKKKAAWWKKLIAVVVFIIAVVVTFVTLGSSSPLTSTAMLSAYAVLAGATIVSLVTVALSALDYTEWAMAFAWTSKEISPLVTVATIIVMVDAINTLATNVTEKGVDVLIDSVLTNTIGISGTEIASGTMTTKIAVSMATKTISAYTSLGVKKLKELSTKNKDLKMEYSKLVEESEKESDVMKGFMNIYAKPATADWSIFAYTFDFPYERGGGVMSLGNIQKTTKQALRKADYDDSAFDGIMLV